MASWGCEVRAGERFVADIAEGTILVILKAYLGVPKEDIHEDSVSLYITVDGKKLVAGNFNPRRHSEQRLCLSIDKKFSLTHTLRDNSLYFFGVTHEKEPEDKKKDKPTVEEASSASVYSHRCKKYSIMSFWGAEVKHGQRLHVKLDQGNYLSLKLASLVCTGNHEEKKSVCLEVDTCDKTIQLARLHPERLPQQVMDLKFDEDIILSHDAKNGTLYLCGFQKDHACMNIHLFMNLILQRMKQLWLLNVHVYAARLSQ